MQYNGKGTPRQWHRNEFESAEHRKKNFSEFFRSKSTISRFGERFRDGQYSLFNFLFAVLLLTVPPHRMESAPLDLDANDKCTCQDACNTSYAISDLSSKF